MIGDDVDAAVGDDGCYDDGAGVVADGGYGASDDGGDYCLVAGEWKHF